MGETDKKIKRGYVKYCFVPLCNSKNRSYLEKHFFTVPAKPYLRKKWYIAARRDHRFLSNNSRLFCCEDHFNLEEDTNYIYYKLMGGGLRLKEGVIPHFFHCQNRKLPIVKTRSLLLKKKKQELMDYISQMESDSSVGPNEDHREKVQGNSNLDLENKESNLCNIVDVENLYNDTPESSQNISELESETCPENTAEQPMDSGVTKIKEETILDDIKSETEEHGDGFLFCKVNDTFIDCVEDVEVSLPAGWQIKEECEDSMETETILPDDFVTFGNNLERSESPLLEGDVFFNNIQGSSKTGQDTDSEEVLLDDVDIGGNLFSSDEDESSGNEDDTFQAINTSGRKNTLVNTDLSMKHMASTDTTKQKRRKSKAKFHCGECGSGFSKKFQLKLHIEKHEKKFKCSDCLKTFRYKSNYYIHLSTHASRCKLQCYFCSEVFTANSALTQHIKIHTNKRVLKCFVCGKTFTYGSSLQSRASNAVFKCIVCSRTQLLENVLKRKS